MSKQNDYFKKEFELLEKTALTGLSELQINEMKKAFFAGGFSVITSLIQQTDKPEDVQTAFLDDLLSEIELYFKV